MTQYMKVIYKTMVQKTFDLSHRLNQKKLKKKLKLENILENIKMFSISDKKRLTESQGT